MADSSSYFDEQRQSFVSAKLRLATISNGIGRQIATPRFGWASWIYARMGLAAQSVIMLLEQYVDDKAHSTLDHVTVGGVCRAILEAQVFVSYLTEAKISEEEWQLRKWTLDIHDCNSRLRLFRALDVKDQVEGFKQQLEELQVRMKSHPLFSYLPKETQTAILVGNRIYVRGMRAALEDAGWNQDQWDGIYNYLSGSVHSSPISFYRSDDRGIDNLSIATYQLSFAGFALEQGHQALSWANTRMMEIFPNAAVPRS
ncbi:hypothetical protein BH10PSE9_BH10PSE9_19580 [soil metagenome]